MRTIKFRGKRVDNGEWVYGYAYKIENKDLWFIDNGKTVSHQVIPETVGQFTGLINKSGKEIYEGDIVKVTVYYPNIEEELSAKYEISYNDKECSFSRILYLAKNIEIIGNIYDNKELL